MRSSLHHAHLFASDLDRTLAFYRGYFDGQVVLDAELAGARNVFMRVGGGRLHLYDRGPKDQARGPIHHIGIQVDDLAGLVARMRADGLELKNEIKDFGLWRYIMIADPDGVLIEAFEVDGAQLPAELQSYFDLA